MANKQKTLTGDKVQNEETEIEVWRGDKRKQAETLAKRSTKLQGTKDKSGEIEVL